MMYNDYPIPTEKLVNVLEVQYANMLKVKTQTVGRVGLLEQKSKLNELYVYINAQKMYLQQLEKQNKNFKLKYSVDNHLKMLSSMGVENTFALNVGAKSCLADYFKCEAEILKLLFFLVVLDNLNYNRTFLTQIMNEQLEIFTQIVNGWRWFLKSSNVKF